MWPTSRPRCKAAPISSRSNGDTERGALRAQMPARNWRLRIALDRNQLSLFVIDKLSATHSAIWTDGTRHLGSIVLRPETPSTRAHGFRTCSIRSSPNLLHQGPLREELFEHVLSPATRGSELDRKQIHSEFGWAKTDKLVGKQAPHYGRKPSGSIFILLVKVNAVHTVFRVEFFRFTEWKSRNRRKHFADGNPPSEAIFAKYKPCPCSDLNVQTMPGVSSSKITRNHRKGVCRAENWYCSRHSRTHNRSGRRHFRGHFQCKQISGNDSVRASEAVRQASYCRQYAFEIVSPKFRGTGSGDCRRSTLQHRCSICESQRTRCFRKTAAVVA